MLTQILNLRHLLWRTRGHAWDYATLITPKEPVLDSAYRVYRTVFSGLTPGSKPQYRIGEIIRPEGAISFVACAFLDPERTDRHQRATAHYLIWFRLGGTPESVLADTPASWQKAFLQHVGPLLDASDVFGAHRDDAPATIFRERLDDLEQAITLEGPPLFDDDIKSMVVVEEPERRTPTVALPSRPGYALSRKIQHRVKKAIRQGENVAMGNCSSTRLLPLCKKITDGEQKKRLAESFKGAVEDHFVETRYMNLCWRVWKRLTRPKDFRDGSQALLEAFADWEVLEGIGKAQIADIVSDYLNAHPHDLVVRNLVDELVARRTQAAASVRSLSDD